MQKNLGWEKAITWYHKIAKIVLPLIVISLVILSNEMRIKSIEKKAKEQFQLTDQWRPQTYIENEFEGVGDVVIDHATGLMWQKSGSKEKLTYKKAQTYIQKLNQEHFAGYNNWRIPTLPELLSLLEPEKQSNGLYLHPVFDATQQWCWSVDKRSWGSAWVAVFIRGSVSWYEIHPNKKGYVRAVRP